MLDQYGGAMALLSVFVNDSPTNPRVYQAGELYCVWTWLSALLPGQAAKELS